MNDSYSSHLFLGFLATKIYQKRLPGSLNKQQTQFVTLVQVLTFVLLLGNQQPQLPILEL